MKSINNVIEQADDVALTHSFQDACSDKEFYEYAFSLNVNEEVLKKYTSRLEDSFVEHKNCLN